MKRITRLAPTLLLAAVSALAQKPAQAPAAPPICFSSPVDGESVLIALPPAVLAVGTLRWQLDGMDLEDEHGRTVTFQLDPFTTGIYRVTALASTGKPLCALAISPHAYIASTVPYTDTRSPKQVADFAQQNYTDALRQAQNEQAQAANQSMAQSTQRSQAADRFEQSIRESRRAQIASPPPLDKSKLAPTSNVIQVHFATERAPSTDTAELFGIARSPDNQLRYGTARVTVPETHKRLFVTDPVYWTFKQSDFSAKFDPALSEADFYKGLSTRLGQLSPSSRHVLVFVHGFNNGFMEDIYKTAQLAYETHYPGVPIMFDWPTKNGLLDYTHDRTEVDNSKQHLADFLNDLAARSGAGTVDVVAHSMGNRLLLEALDILRHDNRLTQLGQIIMAAPDVDSGRLIGVTEHLVEAKVITRITVYGSHKDWAMWCSRHENGGLTVVGALPPAIADRGSDQIDASALPMNYIGHDYFLTSRPVLDDIGLLLRDGTAPPRSGMLPVPGTTYSFWRFSAQ